MDIQTNWPAIRKHFNQSCKTNFHVSIASVDAENNPTVTPIESLFLNTNQTGFYFEKFPVKLPLHSNTNRNVCVPGVNSNTWFWLKSLIYGRFKTWPAIKMYGQLGEKRKATDKELLQLKKRMKITGWLKGNKYLWGDMLFVREIAFTKAGKINPGRMTEIC